jgi:hypothetical protein
MRRLRSVFPFAPKSIAARGALGLLLIGGAAAPVAAAAQSTPEAEAPGITAAADAVLAEQTPDGGFTGFSGEEDAGFTALAIIALAAAAEDGVETGDAIARATSWLEENIVGYAEEPGRAGIAAGAVVAAGEDPRDFGGVNLVEAMKAPLPDPETAAAPGLMGNDVNDHAMIMLGLVAAGEPVDPAMVTALEGAQAENDAWAYDASTAPEATDSNTTALVIQALVAAGAGDGPAVATGLESLALFRAADGGYAYQLSDPMVADANSTALVIQAIIATGGDPAAAEWGDAPAALARFMNPDGSFRYMEGDADPNLYAALQAVPAMAADPYPTARLCPADGAAVPDCITLGDAA